MPSQAAGEKGSSSITSRLYAPSATSHLPAPTHTVSRKTLGIMYTCHWAPNHRCFVITDAQLKLCSSQCN